jgi:D-aminoacyl-tRNA deacylase
VRAVVQRVSSAAVTVDGTLVGRIGTGLLVFVGVEHHDSQDDVRYIVNKVRELRIFEDAGDPARRLNRSVQDVQGSVLVVSQFTLSGDCRKGRRPSFDGAAAPAIARPLYDSVVDEMRRSGLTVETGAFQTMMKVSLENDGPVTLLLDSRRRF